MDENKTEMTEAEKKSAAEFENIKKKLAEGMRFVCPKHGDCTEDNLYISYLEVDKEKKTVKPVRHIYCNHCLDDLFQGLVKQGKLTEVKVGVDKKVLDELGVPVDNKKYETVSVEKYETESAEPTETVEGK